MLNLCESRLKLNFMSFFIKLFGMTLREKLFGKKKTQLNEVVSVKKREYRVLTFSEKPEPLKGYHPNGNPCARTRAQIYESKLNIKERA
jgi:hypothetical protein